MQASMHRFATRRVAAASPAGAPLSNSSSSRRGLTIARDSKVQDLIARDSKKTMTELKPEWEEERLAKKKEDQEKAPVVKSKKQRQADMPKVPVSAGAAVAKTDGPKRCKEAIDKGLDLFEAKQYQEAIGMFNLALELPGNGAYREATSPREFSCPSDLEEHGALFNMACCYAQMGQKGAALTCIDGLLEAGFTDYTTLRTDPDIAPAQGQDLEALIEKYSGLAAKMKNFFPFGKAEKKREADPNVSKSWTMW